MANKVVSLTRTCDACPSQWDGALDDGRSIYIRFRWGYLRAEIDGVIIFGKQISDSLDGVL